ncbi:TPA: flagellar transcriptional regulator FlrD [Vibrio cholerae]|uniref:flagellar transcriptional regulator FlrD n=1 Tax=Vibrio cholerae TaxID=666 RepID=UPI000E0BAFF8|nr:flagellar transcriptional regulator FlrD [Vibrio cholerae]HBK7258226.1 flagellar transcriptional regulator FlrD [Vibrio cholerae]HBK7269113.1 flagellar transcriptional regulator FlrD [Vibrio cholerae]HBK7291811.1 flagellar transcriptional regulator FlrD [Vibrio cholerae]HBK7294760.1 flagellar transcriptional regulator FlrD [Vibrio cholerae]HDZ9245597.1 flagellar transcriptional regulator FlrD [Vibrio cholerae]
MGRNGSYVMVDLIWLTPPVIAGGAVFVVLCIMLALWRLKRGQHRQSETLRQQIRNLDRELQKSNKQLLEVRSVMVGLGQKVSEQQDIIRHLNERLLELENTDADARLYTRASKMVQLGADLNELIQECELPKAEAELMMSLQNKLAGKESIPPLESHPEVRANKAKS